MIGLDACVVCGCTDEAACPGGCAWILPGICSACGDDFVERMPEILRLSEAANSYRRLVEMSAPPERIRMARQRFFSAARLYERVLFDQARAREGRSAAPAAELVEEAGV